MVPTERSVRIPLFARVDALADVPLGPMYAWNISGGGLYLKAPGLSADDVAVGRGLELQFSLPDGGPNLALSAEVVWVDPTGRDEGGESAIGLGLRFSSLDEPTRARIQGFVEAFHYGVVAFGLATPDFAREALGDLFGVEPVANVEALLKASASGRVGLILLGESCGSDQALQALRQLVDSPGRHPPILYCADHSGESLEDLIERHANILFARLPLERLELRNHVRFAIEAFVLSFRNELLADELERVLERLRRENEYLRDRVQGPSRVEGMVGDSPPMQRVYELIERVAPLPTSVMILGETGTGKELVVRAIHARSARKNRPFIAQNCAALTETLLDNELFGHVRGSYTGARQDSPGLFEAADGGTVFLDEVGEMPPAMQAKLLRVLENGEVRRIGESKTRHVDVRVLCATHRDLDLLVKEGSFRDDLLYRLRTFVITLPPLRERRTDVPQLAAHFLKRFAERHGRPSGGLTVEAMRLLEEYPWPGNARELEHTMERVFVLARSGGKIDAGLVREALGQPAALERPQPDGRGIDQVLLEYERELVDVELKRAGGVIAEAARTLGLDRTTLSKRLKRLGLDRKHGERS